MPENIVVGQRGAGGRGVPRQVLRPRSSRRSSPTDTHRDDPRRLTARPCSTSGDPPRPRRGPGRAGPPRRRARAARRRACSTLDAALARAPPRAAEALRAEQNAGLRGDRRRQAGAARTPPTPLARDEGAVGATVKELTEAARGGRGASCRRSLRDAAQPARPRRAADEDTVAARGRRGRTPTGRDHLELAGERIDMERGARLSGSRFAYLRGDLVLLELALVRWALHKLRGHGFEPVDPAGARPRGGAVRHRLPARHRAADLPPARRRPLPRRHQRGRARVAARRRDPRRRRAAAALRRLLAVLPPRGRRRGQGHARHLPRAPVRQGRDVLLRRARRVARTSTSGCWRSRRRSCSELGDPLPRGQHRGRRPRRLGRQEVRLRGVAARARAATAS